MSRHRYVIVVEARHDEPPDAEPLAARLKQARRSLRALFLSVLACEQIPNDQPTDRQIRRMDPLNTPADVNDPEA